MTRPKLDAPVSDEPLNVERLTDYDRLHLITYLRLLDADQDGAAWQEVAQIVLKIDPEAEPTRARHAYDTHLARAKWMTRSGYRHLLAGGDFE